MATEEFLLNIPNVFRLLLLPCNPVDIDNWNKGFSTYDRMCHPVALVQVEHLGFVGILSSHFLSVEPPPELRRPQRRRCRHERRGRRPDGRAAAAHAQASREGVAHHLHYPGVRSRLQTEDKVVSLKDKF